MSSAVTNFNLDLYRMVRDKRKELGLPVADLNIPIPDHPLIGKRFLNTSNSTEYTVKSVNKQWYCGWYHLIVAEKDNGSSVTRFWDNIDCWDKTICMAIRDAEQELVFLDVNHNQVLQAIA